MFKRFKPYSIIFDLWLGIYSNIPLCCCLFFIKRSIKGTGYIAAEVHKERNPRLPFGKNPPTKPRYSYVPCDKCYHRGNVNEIVKGKPEIKLFKYVEEKAFQERTKQIV